jgi:histidine triad (HIT) family protein
MAGQEPNRQVKTAFNTNTLKWTDQSMTPEHKKCVFCEILAGRLPAAIVYRDDACIALLDAFPLKQGHLLLIPVQHAQHIEELPAASVAHLFRLGAEFSAAWRQKAAIPATNLVLNNGSAANQHVPHVHLHVIPREQGDGWLIAWRYLTRFFNPLSYIGRERRLAREAARVRSLLLDMHTP